MDQVWAHGPLSADVCRQALKGTWPMKESTVRTVLGRLEEKGYVTHTVDGRTYIYSAADAPVNVAARAVRHLIERFCGGSAEDLVVGLVRNDVLSATELERIARTIAQRKKGQP